MFGTLQDARAVGSSYGQKVAESLLNGTDLSVGGLATDIQRTAFADFEQHAAEFRNTVSPELVTAWKEAAVGVFITRLKTQARLVPQVRRCHFLT